MYQKKYFFIFSNLYKLFRQKIYCFPLCFHLAVSINIKGCFYRAVSKNSADGFDICTILQHPRCECVPEIMKSNRRKLRTLQQTLKSALNCPGIRRLVVFAKDIIFRPELILPEYK